MAKKFQQYIVIFDSVPAVHSDFLRECLDDFIWLLLAFPELKNLIISKDAIGKLKTGNDFEKREALKKIFSEYMRSSDENVSKAVQQLALRLKNSWLLMATKKSLF